MGDILTSTPDNISAGIKNYKISNITEKATDEGHVWNYAFLENKWYHLDLTWDDPITSNNSDVLIYDFFLITNKQLQNTETSMHKFNKLYYPETKNS